MYQHTELIGHIGRVEMKYTPAGTPVTSASLATSYWKPGRDGAEGVRETEWWNLEVWNRAERFVEQCVVGSLVHATGRLKTERWQDQNGNPKSRIKFVVETWRFLRLAREEAPETGGADVAAEPEEETIF